MDGGVLEINGIIVSRVTRALQTSGRPGEQILRQRLLTDDPAAAVDFVEIEKDEKQNE